MIKSALIKTLAFIIAVLQPLQTTLMALGIFIAVDLFTGIWLGIRTGKFSSKKLGHSVSKIVLYFLALLVCQISDTTFNLPKMADVVAALIVVTEITSILENISTLTGIPILEKITGLLKRST